MSMGFKVRGCWFRLSDESPWTRGGFHAWAFSGEKVNDCECNMTVAIVEHSIAGSMHAVELRNLNFGEARPT